MLLEQYEDIRKLIINSNKYPYGEKTIHNIFKEIISPYYVLGKKENRYNVEWELSYLTDRIIEGVSQEMYLLVMKDTKTKEYVIATVTYISGEYGKHYLGKNYNFYKFDILDVGGTSGN